jgi:hypothetical protein
MRRAVVLALLALVAGFVLWMYFPEYFPWGHAPQKVEAAVEPEHPIAPPIAERLARIDTRLRLPPDQRAIAAIADVHRLVHGGPASEATVEYASGSWKVAYAGERLAVLSPFPRFDALLALLEEWAAKERGRPGAVQLDPDLAIRPELQALLNRFDDAAAFELLTKVDAGWRSGKTTVGDLLAATDALAQLCLVVPHDFPASDRLAARALASLALARQVAPDRALRAEVSLAYALGYVSHATALAERLPRDEPLAAFVRRDFGALERVAEWSASADVQFYYAARLVRRSPVEWTAWYREQKPERALRSAIVRTALDERDRALGDFVPELYATLLLTQFGVPLAKGAPPEAALTQCAALDGKLAESARGLRGPFADAALYRDSYRAACLSAVYRKLVYFAEVKGAPEAALALARKLPETNPDFADLRAWTELVAGGASDPDAPTRLAKAIAAKSALGAEARQALARKAIDALPADDPQRSEIGDSLAAWLDSRASGRVTAGDLAHEVFLEPDLEERLYAAALDVDRLERPLLAARLASFRRDWLALWSIAESDTFQPDERMAALEGLERQKPLEATRLRRGYERLLTENVGSEPLRRQFARYLEKGLGKRKAAREVLLPILDAHETFDAASDSAAGIIARLYREDGDPRSAWALLEPRIAGQRVPYEAARAQVALGDLASAEQIARDAYAHYKHSLAPAAELSAVLWQAGRDSEAADVIAKFPIPASDKDRCWHFCRAFVRVFHGKPTAEVEPAFRELVTAQVDIELLSGMIDTYRGTAEPETALALSKLLGDSLEARTETYKSLKHMQGEREAALWLMPKISRSERAAAAKVFYDRQADELLWKLIEDPDHPSESATWLLCAAAFAREEPRNPSHATALATYFTAHQATLDEQLGAALAGLIEPEILLQRLRTESELSRVAYYLGASAESARDLRGALRMYQLARSSRQKTPSRDLALEAVTRINDLDTSLDALAADPPRNTVLAAGS